MQLSSGGSGRDPVSCLLALPHGKTPVQLAQALQQAAALTSCQLQDRI